MWCQRGWPEPTETAREAAAMLRLVLDAVERVGLSGRALARDMIEDGDARSRPPELA